jgi:hypothetical protein
MSAQDRRAEREVNDFFLEQIALEQPKQHLEHSRWKRIKQFGEGFLTGLAVGSVIRKVL